MIYLPPTPEPKFPPVSLADEQGFLAYGGQLNPVWIIEAYQRGIFPWFNDDQPYLWFSPDPRLVLFPDSLKISKSMRNVFRKQSFRFTCDHDFDRVIGQCSTMDRPGQDGTWITGEMVDVYSQLHRMGYAHSFEVYSNNELIGGIYGLCIGRVFFGESMFSLQPNASKAAFMIAVRWMEAEKRIALIDCQVETPHLISLGAQLISRNAFTGFLTLLCNENMNAESWKYAFSGDEAANLIG